MPDRQSAYPQPFITLPPPLTEAGLAAISIELEAQKPKTSKPEPKPASPERKPRGSTKQSLLIDLLKRPGGATLAEIVEATGWQPHTVRGAMAGALKKKLGLTIDSAKDEARGRVYRLA